MPDLLLAWVLTYLMHSTLLLGGVWLLTAVWRRLPTVWAEALWRSALLGGVLTASVQLALDLEPAGGRMAMPGPAAVANAAPTFEAAARPLAPAPAVASTPTPFPALGVLPEPAGPQPEPVDPRGAAAPTSPAGPSAATWLPRAGAVLWLLGLLAFFVRHGRARRGLHARLAARTPVAHGPLRARLEDLTQAAGLPSTPALSEVAGLGSPLAIGVRRPEIVIPARAEHDLTPAQQGAMLAHELAHHVRRDALWQSVTRWVSGVLFFQPLNLVARKRLGETAELLADAWAVERIGCSRSLAECLTVVASWMVHAPRSQPAPAMAAHGSMLAQRVGRLVEHDLPPAASRGRNVLRIASLLPWIAVVLAAPAVAVGAAGDPTPTSPPPAVAAAPEQAPEQAGQPSPAARIVSTAPASVALGDPAALEHDIQRLEEEVRELLGLLARVPHPPAALTKAAATLTTRLTNLKSQRAALGRAPSPEMPR